MALQFIYSSWQENSVDFSIKRMSEGVRADDVEYILKAVSVTNHYDTLPDDETNKELANTLYLKLPSSAYAIVRTGYYVNENSLQSNNYIVHAYIQENGEEISPMLYSINNCFRVSLTSDEQELLLSQPDLPTTPFPRPQFKLSQAEIRKFFSPGRLRALACLLQAVIDCYGNSRTIILNDTYPSLKYWFFGQYGDGYNQEHHFDTAVPICRIHRDTKPAFRISNVHCDKLQAVEHYGALLFFRAWSIHAL